MIGRSIRPTSVAYLALAGMFGPLSRVLSVLVIWGNVASRIECLNYANGFHYITSASASTGPVALAAPPFPNTNFAENTPCIRCCTQYQHIVIRMSRSSYGDNITRPHSLVHAQHRCLRFLFKPFDVRRIHDASVSLRLTILTPKRP
jgi:hypothetical protein